MSRRGLWVCWVLGSRLVLVNLVRRLLRVCRRVCRWVFRCLRRRLRGLWVVRRRALMGLILVVRMLGLVVRILVTRKRRNLVRGIWVGMGVGMMMGSGIRLRGIVRKH